MGLAPALQAYHALRHQLRQRQRGASSSVPFGLSDAQWADLVWLTWRPDEPLLLAFRDGCTLPRALHFADGALIPVATLRSGPGRLHAWFRAENATSLSLTGTLTALVRQRNAEQLYALTAGHVLAAATTARAGDRVILRDQNSNRGVNGKLAHWTPSFHAGSSNTPVDAGIAALPLEQAKELMDAGLLLPAGISETVVGDQLSLLTQDTTIPTQIIGLTSVILSVGTDGTQMLLVEGLAHQADNDPQAGDSGAPLWNARSRIAAMHIGGELSNGQGNGVAIPIRRALDWCQCDVLERGAPLQARAVSPLAAVAAPVRQTAATADAELTLARTLWGEARGEGVGGMEAVACVVLNRVRRQTYWGKTVTEVCRKPYQFSCWNANDPNSSKLSRLTDQSPELTPALSIARAAIVNQLADTTAGATHYHARRLSPPPRWARGHATCAEIGNHLFYNNID